MQVATARIHSLLPGACQEPFRERASRPSQGARHAWLSKWHNVRAMVAADDPNVLWCLRGHGRDVRCFRHRARTGLELRILWGEELFLTEIFRDEDQLRGRAEDFRVTLEARGWRSLPAAPGAEDRRGQSWSDDRVIGATDGAGRAAEGPAPLRGADGRRPTVLVVDDEAAIRSFLRSYLEEAGYAVCEAGDVDGALNMLDESAVDAVVLDLRMPDPMGWGRTGFEVLAFIRLHSAFAALPVLILTGHALEPEEQSLIARQKAHLFLKPDGYRLLLPRLDELTGRRDANRS